MKSPRDALVVGSHRVAREHTILETLEVCAVQARRSARPRQRVPYVFGPAREAWRRRWSRHTTPSDGWLLRAAS
jgi:hypothetical protein